MTSHIRSSIYEISGCSGKTHYRFFGIVFSVPTNITGGILHFIRIDSCTGIDVLGWIVCSRAIEYTCQNFLKVVVRGIIIDQYT